MAVGISSIIAIYFVSISGTGKATSLEETCTVEVNGLAKPCEKFEKDEDCNYRTEWRDDPRWNYEVVPEHYQGVHYINASFEDLDDITGQSLYNLQISGPNDTLSCRLGRFLEDDHPRTEGPANITVNFKYIAVRSNSNVSVQFTQTNAGAIVGSDIRHERERKDSNISCNSKWNTTIDLSVSPDALTVSFFWPEEVNSLRLTLMSGNCSITCNGDPNKCVVSLSHETFRKVKGKQWHKEPYKNVTRGYYYCVRMERGDCPYEEHTLQSYTKQFGAPCHDCMKGTKIPEQKSIYFAVLGILLAVLLVGAILYIKKRQSFRIEPQNIKARFSGNWQNTLKHCEPRNVVLLYSRDSPPFCKVMQSFKCLLEKIGNLRVCDCLDIEAIAPNISGWLNQQLTTPSTKIIMVVSEGAVLRQKALLGNRNLVFKEPHCLDRVFTCALRQLQDNPSLGGNYEKVYNVKFEDVSDSWNLQLIVPLKCFTLMKNFGRLIVELHGLPANAEPTLEDLKVLCQDEMDNLKSSVTILKEFYEKHPNYLSGHFLHESVYV